jgi:hypothetical protein
MVMLLHMHVAVFMHRVGVYSQMLLTFCHVAKPTTPF